MQVSKNEMSKNQKKETSMTKKKFKRNREKALFEERQSKSLSMYMN